MQVASQALCRSGLSCPRPRGWRSSHGGTPPHSHTGCQITALTSLASLKLHLLGLPLPLSGRERGDRGSRGGRKGRATSVHTAPPPCPGDSVSGVPGAAWEASPPSAGRRVAPDTESISEIPLHWTGPPDSGFFPRVHCRSTCVGRGHGQAGRCTPALLGDSILLLRQTALRSNVGQHKAQEHSSCGEGVQVPLRGPRGPRGPRGQQIHSACLRKATRVSSRGHVELLAVLVWWPPQTGRALMVNTDVLPQSLGG